MKDLNTLIQKLISARADKLTVPQIYVDRNELLRDAEEALNPHCSKPFLDWFSLFRTPGGKFAPKYPISTAFLAWIYSSMLLIFPLIKILGDETNNLIFAVLDFGLALIPGIVALLWHFSRAKGYLRRELLLENTMPITEEEARQNIVQTYLKLFEHLEAERVEMLSFAQALRAKFLDTEDEQLAEYQTFVRTYEKLEEKVSVWESRLDLLERLRTKANAAILFTSNKVSEFLDDNWFKDAKVTRLLEEARAQVSEKVFEPVALCELGTRG